jgi:hypothetical protein
MRSQLRCYSPMLCLLLVGIQLSCSSSTPSTVLAQSNTRTLQALAGTWQATFLGNTGCGLTSMLVTFTLDSSGNATDAAITGHYVNGGNAFCIDGGTSSGNTFTINSLNSDGAGTAVLGCGSACGGWNFQIQVSRDGTEFNLVDVDPQNTNNLLQGVAILQ